VRGVSAAACGIKRMCDNHVVAAISKRSVAARRHRRWRRRYAACGGYTASMAPLSWRRRASLSGCENLAARGNTGAASKSHSPSNVSAGARRRLVARVSLQRSSVSLAALTRIARKHISGVSIGSMASAAAPHGRKAAAASWRQHHGVAWQRKRALSHQRSARSHGGISVIMAHT